MNALLGIFPPALVAGHYAQVFHPAGSLSYCAHRAFQSGHVYLLVHFLVDVLSGAACQELSCRLYPYW
jgi:hypothetical protein